MPNLTFVLPHWMYWMGLVLFPLLAMFILRRQRARPPTPGVNLGVGYLLLIIGGFVGLHRFYVRSRWGLVFIPLFIGILFANIQGREARDELSAARNDVMVAEFELERAQKAAEEDGAKAPAVQSRERQLKDANSALASAQEDQKRWDSVSAGFGLAIVVLLLVDAFMLPKLIRQCAAREHPQEPLPSADFTEAQAQVDHDPGSAIHTWLTRPIDRLSGFAGHFVAYWSIIAVFVYYYEVLARYVFNSPTNWAHESMFLMFGMQYLIAGAFALRDEAHVRVDVIYMHLPDRGKALVDVITSIFFFIFAIALFWTGWTFAWDSVQVGEVSFTEWAIQHWPVKLAIPLGALLILLQGVSHLIKDVLVLVGKEARRGS